MDELTTTISLSKTTVAAHVESTIPSGYRLMKKKDDTIVLQGAYHWSEGFKDGHEWRDIPTIEEEKDEPK